MWLLSLTFLLPSTSTLRSLSWAVFALSCLLLLAGLYVWNSAIYVLSTLVSKVSLAVASENLKIYKDGKLLPYTPPELLAQTVTQLVAVSEKNIKRMAVLGILAFMIAVTSLYQEAKGITRYYYENAKVQKVGDARFWITPSGQSPIYVTVCRDYQLPPWQTGWTLTKVWFVDEGNCWSRDPNKGGGFYALRRENGEPILTNN
jgi:hypothetical protein